MFTSKNLMRWEAIIKIDDTDKTEKSLKVFVCGTISYKAFRPIELNAILIPPTLKNLIRYSPQDVGNIQRDMLY